MATSNATLGLFLPKDMEIPFGGLQAGAGIGASIEQRNGSAVIRLPLGSTAGIIVAGSLLRTAVTGYTGTNGIKVNVGVSSVDGLVAGKIAIAAAWQLCGQTDVPSANVTNFPAIAVPNVTNEPIASITVNATVAGGITYGVISCTIANIKNGQATNPAIGDFYRLRIRRAGTDATNDTLKGDAFLHFIELLDY